MSWLLLTLTLSMHGSTMKLNYGNVSNQINVCRPSSIRPIFLYHLNQNLNYSTTLSKRSRTLIFTQFRPMGVTCAMRTGGRTEERHDKANCRFS